MAAPEHPRAPRPVRARIGGRDIVTHGIPVAIFQDLYHYLMRITWPQLFAAIGAFFLIFDFLFGCLYFLVPGCIANLNPSGFAGDFFFSVETLATVGYGDMHPQTLYGHVVAMVEMFVGLMMLALITGIMFARFSRPRARFLFAKFAVIRPLDGRPTLMFRAANARQNVVQEASANLRLLRDTVSSEGLELRRVIELALVRHQQPAFSIGWTIMHVIDDSSPLSRETEASLRAADASFILSVSGTDETTGHTLIARQEYPVTAIHWNKGFRDVLTVTGDGATHFDYTCFHDIEDLP
ncbi:MAG TPA: ion channel [Steroidobacteraceae bacterium]|nr:ion channel [Steroidobacteraceae bacterium]